MVISGYSASSTTKTGRHDIAEILLKVALNTINQIKTNQMKTLFLLENLEVQLQKLNSLSFMTVRSYHGKKLGTQQQ